MPTGQTDKQVELPVNPALKGLSLNFSEPPIDELRSPMALELAKLKERQDKMFNGLSKNAKLCHKSIVELDRYDALMGDTGIVAVIKEGVVTNIKKLKMAVIKFETMPIILPPVVFECRDKGSSMK